MEKKAPESGCPHQHVQTIQDLSAACEACAPGDEWSLCYGWQVVLADHLPPLIQEYSVQWGRSAALDVVRTDALVAQRLVREVLTSRKRKMKDFDRVLRHCAARAVEQRVVRELLANPTSSSWDIVFATVLELACRWKGVVPGPPTAAQFAAGTWFDAMLGDRLDGRDDLYDEIVSTTTDAYAKIRRKLSTFRGECRLDTWCVTIVRNTFIDRFRHRLRRTDKAVNAADDGQRPAEVIRTVYLSQGDDRPGRTGGDIPDAIDPRATYDETDVLLLERDAMGVYRASTEAYIGQQSSTPEEAATLAEIFHQAWIQDRPHQEIADAHEGYDRNRVDDVLSDYRLSPEGQRLKQELHAHKRTDDPPETAG